MTDLATVGFDVDSSGLKTADRSLDALGATAMRAGQQIDGATDSMGAGFTKLGTTGAAGVSAMQAQIDKLTGVTGRGAASVLQYGGELDKLRAKFNPLFAVSQKYEAELQEIARAEKLGAISAREAGQARERAAQSLTVAGNAAQVYGRQMRGAGAHTANLGFQLNDIGVMMAAGQNPLMLAVQQGTQINQIFGQMGGGVKALRGVGAAFMSIINPMSLMTIGVIAGGAALVQWGVSALGAGRDSRTFEDRMDDLSAAIAQYKEFTDIAALSTADLAERFGTVGAAAQQSAQYLADWARVDALNELSAAITGIVDEFGDLSRASDELILGARAGDLSLPYARLRNELDLTNQDAIRLYDALRNLDQAEGPDAAAQAAVALNAAFLDVYGTVDRIPAELQEAARATGLLALRAAEIGSSIEGADVAARAYADSMARAAERNREAAEAAAASQATGQQMLDTLNAEIALHQAIARYGEDSAQVAALRVRIERNQYSARLATVGVTQELHAQIMRAWDVERQMAAVNIAAPIAAAAAEANRLAVNLGISLDTARLLQTAQAISAENAPGYVSSGRGSDPRQFMQGGAQDAANGIVLARWREAADAARDALSGGGSGGGGGVSEAAREAERELQELQDTINRWANDTRTPFEEYRDEMIALNGVLEQSPEFIETYGRAVQSVTDDLADQLPMVNDVADAWGEFVVGGFRDFKGFVDGVLSSFKSMLQEMISTAARNRIMLSLGFGAASPGAAAAGVPAQGGGLLSSLSGGLGAFGGNGGGLLGGLAGGSGLMGGLGNALSGGLGNVFSVGANAAAAGGGIMASVGAALPILGGIAVAVSLFSKKTKELDNGIRLTVDGFDLAVDTFKKTQTSRFWGLSKSTKTSMEAAGADLADPLNAAFDTIGQNILGMAGTLGVGASAFDNFTHQVDLSTKDMSESEIQSAVEGQLQDISNAMSNLIISGTGLRKEGESGTDAITRLSSAITTVNGMFEGLGFTMYQATLQGAGAASAIVDVFGSLDQFTQTTALYFQNFYSQQEQVAEASRQFAQGMANLGFDRVPQTMAEFRGMVDNLMAGGEDIAAAGVIALAPLFVQMQELNGAATSATAVLAERAELERRILELEGNTVALRQLEIDALDPSNRGLQERINGLTDAAAADTLAAQVAGERAGLEAEMLRLMGNTAELRRRELEALDPSNRALQEMIFGLEDAARAMDDLDTNDFATRLDFMRAASRQQIATEQQFNVPGVTQTHPATSAENTAETERAEAQQVTQAAILAAALETSENVERMADLIKRMSDMKTKWDIEGLPAERTP